MARRFAVSGVRRLRLPKISISTEAQEANNTVAATRNYTTSDHAYNEFDSSSPGRNNISHLEGPYPSITVVSFSSTVNSRPGPVFWHGKGVFQPFSAGEYNSLYFNFVPDTRYDSSHIWLPSMTTSHNYHPSGRPWLLPTECTQNSMMEAPKSPDTVECRCRLSADCSCHPRHSVPVSGAGEGVFQLATSGKYVCNFASSLPEIGPINSDTNPEASVDSAACRSPIIETEHLSSPSPLIVSGELTVYYQNVRGMRTKIDDVFLAISSCHYDVIVLTETWLDDKIFSSQVFGDSYTVLRTDRSKVNSRKSTGGGVLIAISDNLNGYIDPTSVNVTLEQVWVKVKLQYCSMSIGAIYLPPDRKNDLASVSDHIESIAAVYSRLGDNDLAILLGDYNQSGLVWNTPRNDRPSVDALQSSISVACASLLDGFSLHGLSQINHITNQNARILDFALVNEATLSRCLLEEAAEPLSVLDSNHPALELTVSLSQSIVLENIPDEPGLDFHRTNTEGLLEALRQTDWHFLESADDINVAVDCFTSLLKSHLVDFIPLRRPSPKPPWGNAHLRHLKCLRSKALRVYCRSRCLYTKQHFARASDSYRIYNRYLYKRYSIRTQEDLRRHPAHFWKFVKSKRKDNNGLPAEMFLGNEVVHSTAEKCRLFATHFKSAFNDTISSRILDACRDTPRDVCHLGNLDITPNQVKFAINKLRCSISSPDGIPTYILKKCCDELVSPLTSIFNLSLRQRCFPTSWKTSIMFPVFKKGNRQNVENYRGITSLCACSKVFEILMNDLLFDSCKNYIAMDQHGFYPKRSTTTNLVQFASFCIKNIDAGAQVDTVYTDLKSAFDRVDHGILLERLGRIGISADIISWFKSYLLNRRLTVSIGSVTSEHFSNLSGVPQGSNLGPLLFSIFINELSVILPPGYRLLYADDVKIYMVMRSIEDCYALQRLLNRFTEWCTRNMLTLSIHKCNVITFHRKLNPTEYDYAIDGQSLDRVYQVHDLGIILDSAFTFRSHYNDIISRANRQLGFMFKISQEFNDPLCLRSLYCTLVRSILEFNSVVWCPYQSTWTARVEAIQRKFVRYALRRLPWRDALNLPRYEDRCRLLGLQTLEQRRSIDQAVFVAKIFNGEADAPELLGQLNIYAPERLLRQRNFLLLEPRNTLYGLHDPVRFMSASFNEVFAHFDFGSTASAFKHRLTELNRMNH